MIMARHIASRGRRTDYEWHRISDMGGAIDGAEGTKVLGVTTFSFGESGTIVRLRGSVFVQLDSAAVDERVGVTIGIGVFDDTALAAGVASLPGPDVDRSSRSWMWLGTLWLSSGAEASVVPDDLMNQMVVDSKAMRKVKAEGSLAVIAQIAASVDQGGDVDWGYAIDFLDAS